MNLQNFTYNGCELNMNIDCAFYCYLICDIDKQMYYSGSRGVKGTTEHDLLITYFTSSTVVDFRDRLRSNTNNFIFKVEYFESRKLAFDAESKFHKLHNVGRNPQFYNSINCGYNQNCGAGSILCKDENNKIYRISSAEYKLGGHSHTCKNRLIIRYKDNPSKTESIHKSMFDSSIHNTQFSNYVLSYDTIEHRNVRIKKELFDNNRYVGITKGMISVFDKQENKSCMIQSIEYHANKDRYVSHTAGYVSVINNLTGKSEFIEKTQYDRTKYSHSNTGKTVQFSLIEKRNIAITIDEYHTNKWKYANTASKWLWIIDDVIFSNLKDLKKHVRNTYGISIPRISADNIVKDFTFINKITKDEYIRDNKIYEYQKN